MSSESHEADILWRAILALSIYDRPLKHVTEFSLGAQVVGPYKVHHAPILQEVVLQRVAGQHHAAPAKKQSIVIQGCLA